MQGGLDKYLEEAEQLWEIEDNYFEAITWSTNTSPTLEVDPNEDQTLHKDLDDVKRQLFDTHESDNNILKSPMVDTDWLLQEKQQPVNTSQVI